MRPILVIVLLASLAACSNSSAGSCSSDADCPSGAACDAQQHVCVVRPGTVTQPDVTLSAPAAGDVADGTIAAVATAHAPGGVTALSFEVRSTAGALLATAAGTAAAADPASFSATIRLAGAADGSAIVQAVITYGAAQKLTSAAVQILLDQRPPAIALQTDGRATLLAGGQTATVTAQIGDGAGTGVVDSSVLLRIANHADVPGTGSAGIYTFSLPIDDSLSAAGASATVPFQILAADRLGHTGSTVAGDPRAVLRIDRDAPQITGIAVVTPAPFTRPDDTKVFDPAAGLLKVQATITDGKGLDESTVCLRAVGETGPCPHLGTNHGAGNVYDFDLPPPVGSFDGESVPLFTISANDLFASVVPAGFQAEHQAASALQSVAFDNTPPVVTVTADTTPYARSGAPIDVVATITDGSGVKGAQLVPAAAAPVTSVGNVFTFKLNPGAAPPLVEGPFAIQVVAQDNLGHSTPAGASRVIDGAPPALTVQIFKDGDPVPAIPGVTYPAAVPDTGWTGGTFIYSDRVRVRGTLSDLSGVGSATLHVDGIGLDGSVTRGTLIDLQCPGTGGCSFDTPVTLKDVSGAFHTSGNGVTGTIPLPPDNLDSIPAASLQVTIDFKDAATSFGTGAPAPNAGTNATAVLTTRFLWRQSLPGDAVSGLAIHPSGDVIVTTSGPLGDLYDLVPDQLLPPKWNGGLATAPALIGGIPGTPAVGAGDALGARIYVASTAGVLYAFDPTGAFDWRHDTGAPFAVGPAVTAAGGVDEIVIPDNAPTPRASAPIAQLWRATSATDVTSVPSDEQDPIAAPLILGGGVYFATQTNSRATTTQATHVVVQPIAADGTFTGTASLALDTTVNPPAVVNGGVDPFFGVVTDGTNVFAATNGKVGGSFFAFNPSLSQVVWKSLLPSALSAEPTIGAGGKLYGADVGKNTNTYDLTTGAPASFVPAIGGTGLVPLHGSNGHVYLPRNSGQALLASEGTRLSWQLKPAANTFRSAIMDCQGRLFTAAGSTVYAFVTDDAGLADTPWPSLRRDSRNTGNAGAEKYGMRIAATGACTQ